MVPADFVSSFNTPGRTYKDFNDSRWTTSDTNNIISLSQVQYERLPAGLGTGQPDVSIGDIVFIIETNRKQACLLSIKRLNEMLLNYRDSDHPTAGVGSFNKYTHGSEVAKAAPLFGVAMEKQDVFQNVQTPGYAYNPLKGDLVNVNRGPLIDIAVAIFGRVDAANIWNASGSISIGTRLYLIYKWEPFPGAAGGGGGGGGAPNQQDMQLYATLQQESHSITSALATLATRLQALSNHQNATHADKIEVQRISTALAPIASGVKQHNSNLRNMPARADMTRIDNDFRRYTQEIGQATSDTDAVDGKLNSQQQQNLYYPAYTLGQSTTPLEKDILFDPPQEFKLGDTVKDDDVDFILAELVKSGIAEWRSHIVNWCNNAQSAGNLFPSKFSSTFDRSALNAATANDKSGAPTPAGAFVRTSNAVENEVLGYELSLNGTAGNPLTTIVASGAPHQLHIWDNQIVPDTGNLVHLQALVVMLSQLSKALEKCRSLLQSGVEFVSTPVDASIDRIIKELIGSIDARMTIMILIIGQFVNPAKNDVAQTFLLYKTGAMALGIVSSLIRISTILGNQSYKNLDSNIRQIFTVYAAQFRDSPILTDAQQLTANIGKTAYTTLMGELGAIDIQLQKVIPAHRALILSKFPGSGDTRELKKYFGMQLDPFSYGGGSRQNVGSGSRSANARFGTGGATPRRPDAQHGMLPSQHHLNNRQPHGNHGQLLAGRGRWVVVPFKCKHPIQAIREVRTHHRGTDRIAFMQFVGIYDNSRGPVSWDDNKTKQAVYPDDSAISSAVAAAGQAAGPLKHVSQTVVPPPKVSISFQPRSTSF